MKKVFRLSAAMAVFLAILCGLCLSCFGAEVDYKESNYAFGLEKTALLKERWDHYRGKNVDGGDADSKTNLVIQGYSSKIEELFIVAESDKSAEIELLYQKGVAAGHLAWIYFSHYETRDLDSVTKIYKSKLEIIDSAQDVSYFTENKENNIESCYTELFQIIYTEKIKALAEKDDCKAVKDKIDDAPSDMGLKCKYDEIESDGEDGGNYEAYYQTLIKEINILRRRDETATEMEDIFSKLYPDVSSAEELAEFYNSLNTKTDVVEMNNLLSNKVQSLLESLEALGGDYREAYLTQKRKEVRDAVTDAGNGEIARLSELFSDYTLELAAADAKDALAAFSGDIGKNYGESEAAMLSEIVSEFSKDGGVFDLAESVEAIAKELQIAKTRCVWLDSYLKAVEAIRSYLGENSAFEEQATELYGKTAEEINVGNRMEGDTEPEALSEDNKALDAIIAQAEAESFRIKHQGVLQKADVGVEDMEALGAAIVDGAALSEAASELLYDSLISLGEKYKEATSEKIASTVKDDGAKDLRNADAERLIAAVEALSATDDNGALDLLDLKSEADSLSERADVISALYDSYCEEYLSGKTDKFADLAKKTAVDAAGEIAASEAGDWEEISAEAVIEIIRLAALEDIHAAAEGYEEIPEIAELLTGADEEIKTYSDKPAIRGYADNTVAEVAELIRLEEAARAADKLKEQADGIKEKIEGYEFISPETREELLSKLEDTLSEYTEKTENAADKSGVLEALAEGEEKLSAVADEALAAENAACLADVKERLNSCYGQKEDYSPENYVKILEIINSCNEELAKATSVSEYLAVGDRGVAELDAVENLLEEAKRLSAERLRAEYDRLMLKKYCYSAEGLSSLTEIYEHSLAELSNLSAISDAPKAAALVDERIALMRGVSFQKVYTEDGGLASPEDCKYPGDYNLSEGYFGAVYAEGGIPSDTVLYMNMADSAGIAEQIIKAAKRGNVFLGDEKVERDIIKLLRRCYVSAAVDIDLGGALADGGAYRVSVLIPDGIEMSDIIGVIFIGEGGRIEFHPVTRGESVIEFDTDHFSKYYVVSAGAVDLTPWLVCLSIIVLCQLIIAAILIVRRKKRKQKPEESENIPLAAFAAPTALAVRYKPVGGEFALAALCGAAIALSVLIVYLLIDELKYAKAMRAAKTAAAPAIEEESAVCVPDIPEQPAFVEAEEEPAPILPEAPLASVSVEEADSLMSDVEAIELEQMDNGYVDTEVYRGAKKAEINIDTISESFDDGATVTLNSLKEKGLLPKNVGAVKILARGILDKRLTVVAQDFSHSAVKMILLTGGEAVFTYPSEERGGKCNKKI